MKKLLFLFALILVSCNKDEETRIFTVTTNAIPSEGGTVTLETTELTTGEYEWGDIAHVKAKPSDGYVFEKFSSNATVGGEILPSSDSHYVAGGCFSAIPFAPQINVVPALLQPRYPLGKLPHSNVDSVGYGEE